MIRSTIILITVALASAAGAQSLKERLQQGAGALRDGASAVQQGVATGAGIVVDQVEQNIDSTVDLMTNEATPEATRVELDAMAAETLNRLFAERPGSRELFAESAGHAVFDTRKAMLFGLAAGGGRGVAVSHDGGARTYMNMGTAGVGMSFGIGGFETQVVILFEDPWTFNNFVADGYDASAEGGAMFGSDRTDLAARFVNGRAIFYLSKQGWKVSASAAGTKYWVDRSLN